MENNILKIGTVITFQNKKRYKIIGKKDNKTILIQLDTSKIKITVHDNKVLMQSICCSECNAEYGQTNTAINIDSLSEKTKAKYQKYQSIINEIDAYFAPTYIELSGHSSKPMLKEITKKYRIGNKCLWKIIRLYLQSGFDSTTIIDRRFIGNTNKIKAYNIAPGRKHYQLLTVNGKHERIPVNGCVVDARIKNIMTEMIEIYKKGKCRNLTTIYDLMNQLYFSSGNDEKNDPVLFPPGMRPTLRQFRSFVKMNTTIQERKIAKSGMMKFRNEERLRTKGAAHGDYGPGYICEMDEVEYDCYIVSEENKTAGKPIVYFIIDTDTKLIIAFSVSFENNSVIGLTNCLMNLADDKISLCKKYGRNISEDDWPSFKPVILRPDNGSEYISDEASRIFQEINITRQLVPAGTGSYKADVEQSFHQMMSRLLPLLIGRGAYFGDYGDKGKKEACLTIDLFRGLVLNFIIEHNTAPMRRFKRNKYQRTMNVPPIPKELYKVDKEKFGEPAPIGNPKQFLFSLMKPIQAKVTADGIIYKNLIYYSEGNIWLDQMMYQAEKRSVPINVRIDPRDISSVYYANKIQVFTQIPLAQRSGNDFHGLTLQEYEDYLTEEKNMNYDNNKYIEEKRAARVYHDTRILESTNVVKYSDIKNMKEENKTAKQSENYNNRIANHMEELSQADNTANQAAKKQDENLPAKDTDDKLVDYNTMINKLNRNRYKKG